MRRAIESSRAAFYWLIKTIAWPITRTYVRLRVTGSENVPRSGGCIVVANHASYADAIVLGSAFPRRIVFMITEPIYRLMRLRWFYYMMGTIPVSSGEADPSAMKVALRTLRDGGVIGIFPEGQRISDGALGEGKAGAAMLAARSGALVIPVALIGTREVMPVGSLLPRPHPVRVVIGKPLRFAARSGRRPTRQEIDDFAGDLMNAIAILLHGGASTRDAAGTVTTPS
ncbi:MAG: 1-acyl-sn-glycerol-3-phosphate acyltransferase [Chloroflexi bacterium]|nr:1-acyl-sn-glycerol-3-phosphate acyltransferase [Chloroflexota bacterium]